MPTLKIKDGTELFYKDWGKGPPLVFHHGWPLSSDDWDNQMLFFLGKGFRVIAHDRRGHGRSTQTDTGNDMDTYADDVAALASALNLKDAVHIGHSTGGGEVVRYLARHGTQRARKAAIISAICPVMLKSEKALAASGTGGCCWAEALLASGSEVREARAGDPLLMMREDGSAVYEGEVEKTRASVQPCLRVQTASGISLTCSYGTPMALRRGGEVVYIEARDCLEDDLLPVFDDDGFRWEPIAELAEAGALPVALLSARNGVYAAGDQSGRMVFTHNSRVKQ